MWKKRKRDHNMELVTTHDTGWDEFYCPECGRRFIMRYPPEYRKIILDEGAEGVEHLLAVDPDTYEANRLEPYREWIERAAPFDT